MFFSATACFLNEHFRIEFDRAFQITAIEAYNTEPELHKINEISEEFILDRVLELETHDILLETDHASSDADWQAFEEIINYLKKCNRRKLDDVLYYRRVNVCYRKRRVKCLA
jgi:hypothetical protein